MDKITWANHASFILESGAVRLMTDPWTTGSAFNSGWSLLAEVDFAPDFFAGLTHIWISHEHPDHFSPLSLRLIPEANRRGITVIYKQTRDRRVAQFCEELGFNVLELKHLTWHRLAEGFDIFTGPAYQDTWLYIRTAERSYLNLNDCVPSKSEWKKLVAACPVVDVIFTQFSYANWAGNRDEIDKMRRAAATKLADVERTVQRLKPKVTVPFASFVWFSHDENFYLNAEANRIQSVYGRVTQLDTRCVVLYPGDTWLPDEEHDSLAAIDKYQLDYEAIEGPRFSCKSLEIDELQRLAADFMARMRSNNLIWTLRPLVRTNYLPPVQLYLDDLRRSFSFSITNGLTATERDREACDVAMSSDSLAFCFRFDFGIDTLLVNGRFQELRPGSRAGLSRNFAPARHNQNGNSFPTMFVNYSYVRGKLGF